MSSVCLDSPEALLLGMVCDTMALGWLWQLCVCLMMLQK